MIPLIAAENELLVQLRHALNIQILHHPDGPGGLCLEYSLEEHLTGSKDHAVGLVVPVIWDIPVDGVNIHRGDPVKKISSLRSSLFLGLDRFDWSRTDRAVLIIRFG